MQNLTTISDFDNLLQQQWDFILFKNSATCSVSWWACREVYQAIDDLDLDDVYIVEVLDSPELKYYIADKTWIQHESPQILVFKQWKVVAFANHNMITQFWIKDHL
jgi:bacillithiol system protein YtxJ